MTLLDQYENSDWKDIPQDIKTLCEVIGYNADYWDDDETPPICDKYWKDLTPAQQDAATKLGYTKDTWDNEDSDSDSD